jgi:hypothetical protein
MNGKKGIVSSIVIMTMVMFLLSSFFYLASSTYLNSQEDGYVGFILSTSGYIGPQKERDETMSKLKRDITGWVNKYDAVFFYKGNMTSGIAVLDSCGWFKTNLNIDYTGTETKNVIIINNDFLSDIYVKDDILFPGQYDYHIQGYVDPEELPAFCGSSLYFFSFTDLTEMSGPLYTNIDNANALSELQKIFENYEMDLVYQTYKNEKFSLQTVIYRMLIEGFLSRSMVFAFAGLVFCAIFSMFMTYRESSKYLHVHHIYGASYMRLFLIMSLIFLSGTAIGTFLGSMVSADNVQLLDESAAVKTASVIAAFNFIFVMLIQIFCFLHWMKSYKGRKGNL